MRITGIDGWCWRASSRLCLSFSQTTASKELRDDELQKLVGWIEEEASFSLSYLYKENAELDPADCQEMGTF